MSEEREPRADRFAATDVSNEATKAFVALIMTHMLAGEDPAAAVLRAQYAACVMRIEVCAGLIVHFDVPPELPRLGAETRTAGDIGFTAEALEHGGGSALFVREGALSMLDVYVYDEAWPSEPRVTAILHSLSWADATAKRRSASE